MSSSGFFLHQSDQINKIFSIFFIRVVVKKSLQSGHAPTAVNFANNCECLQKKKVPSFSSRPDVEFAFSGLDSMSTLVLRLRKRLFLIWLMLQTMTVGKYTSLEEKERHKLQRAEKIDFFFGWGWGWVQGWEVPAIHRVVVGVCEGDLARRKRAVLGEDMWGGGGGGEWENASLRVMMTWTNYNGTFTFSPPKNMFFSPCTHSHLDSPNLTTVQYSGTRICAKLRNGVYCRTPS